MLLKHPGLAWIGGCLALGLMGGCVADLGTPDYSDQVGLRDPIDPFPPVPPDPFQPGDERLSVGLFYEGGRSETILINTISTDYFVFAIDENRPIATRSFAEGTSSDRLEGTSSYQIELIDTPFWGGGIIWFEPFDLSDWTTMFVGFKSSAPSFESFELTLQWGAIGEDPLGVALDPRAYGYTNDGEWHFLQIPLQDAIDAGWNPRLARSPFIVGGPAGEPGDVLLIDNLYFTKD